MKIAHLSDLHIYSQHRPKNLLYTELLIEFALDQNIDHLVITGDLTHNSNARDFQALRKTFEKYDLLKSERLSLVIGNHDIFGGVHLAEDVLTFPERCSNVDYENKLMEFNYYFLEIFDNVIRPFPGQLYPYAKILNNIVFIGLNSIAPFSKVKNLFASKGKINKRQIQGIVQLFNYNNLDQLNKIVLIHHHFNEYFDGEIRKDLTFLQNIEGRSMKLRKKKKLLELFQNLGINLILHGHSHKSGEYRQNGLHFVNAGGSIDGNQPGNLKINFITIENQSIFTDIRTLSLTGNREIEIRTKKKQKRKFLQTSSDKLA
jgi:3',5'-cyclic AMP phosphodiesterase CpdA